VKDQEHEFWGDALEAMHEKALMMWKAEYYRMMSASDAFAQHVRKIHIQCSHLPGGVWLVRVVVVPRLAWQREEFFWRMHEISGSYYLS
jgi:hypothetical protein